MRIPSSIPHYPNFSRLLHPSSHNHVQSWFELRCRPWRESGVGVWPDEGDCGSDVFQVSFSYPILKARDWLNEGTLSWRLVVRWKVRLLQWREVWPREWRWAQNIRGIAKKKTKETSRGVTTFPPVGLLRRIMGFLEEVEPKHDWPICTLPIDMTIIHSPFPKPLFTLSPLNF